MSAIIAVIGAGRGSGKTTTMVALIKELRRRGYRVGAIKQIHDEDFSIDKPGKDTWKMTRAGAAIVVAAAPREVTAIKKIQQNERFKEALKLIDGENPEVILVEGNPPMDVPRIFMARNPEGVEEKMPRIRGEIVGIASYSPEKFDETELVRKIPFFALPKDLKKLVDHVEGLLKRRRS